MAETVTSRQRSAPPKELAVYIDLVNRDQDLPDLRERFLQLEKDPNRDPHLGRRELWIQACAGVANELSPETRAFLGPASEPERFRERYGTLQAMRGVLLGLATSHAERYDDYVGGEGMVVTGLQPVTIYYDERGKLAASGTVFTPVIGDGWVRVRKCAVCPRIFWASRRNSECCSTKCRKRYNQRNARAAPRRRGQQEKG